jgi:hypothetical protein
MSYFTVRKLFVSQRATHARSDAVSLHGKRPGQWKYDRDSESAWQESGDRFWSMVW